MKTKLRYRCFWFLILLNWFVAAAQSPWVDSVKKGLEKQKDDTAKVLTLTSLGDYYSTNNPDSGQLYARQALSLSEKLDYDRGKFWSIVSLDHSLYLSGNYTLELDYAIKAVPLAKKLNMPDATGWSYGMLCDSYMNIGDYKTALDYARIIVKMIAVNKPAEIFSAYANFVPLYTGLHKYDSALIWAKKSHVLLKADPGLSDENTHDGKWARTQVYQALGAAFESTGSYDSALYYYNASIPLSINLELSIMTIDGYNGIAKIYTQKNLPDSAIAYAKKVLADKIINAYPAGKLKAAGMLADIYQSQNHTDSSLKYLRIAVGIKDSLYNREKTTAFQNLLVMEKDKQKELMDTTTALQNRYRLYLAIILLLLALVGSGIFISNRRHKQMQQMRNNIADDLHDDIGSTLSSISIMSELAKSNTEGAGLLLSAISENTATIQENMSDIVWAVNPHNDPFANVIQRMNLFAAEILDAKDINLAFACDASLSGFRFTMKQRKNLYLFFKEAINNAAKYSCAEKVSIDIHKKDNQLEMTIADNGKGFDAASVLNGNGMNTFKKRVKELNARFDIRSAVGNGTTIMLRFKIT